MDPSDAEIAARIGSWVHLPLPIVLTDRAMNHVDGRGLANAADVTATSIPITPTGYTRSAPTQETSTALIRFTGQQNDGETGFADLRERYYSATIARFVCRYIWPDHRDQSTVVELIFLRGIGPGEPVRPERTMLVGGPLH